jgi:hypothetical protein
MLCLGPEGIGLIHFVMARRVRAIQLSGHCRSPKLAAQFAFAGPLDPLTRGPRATHCTVKCIMVVEVKVSPGRSTVDGNAG